MSEQAIPQDRVVTDRSWRDRRIAVGGLILSAIVFALASFFPIY